MASSSIDIMCVSVEDTKEIDHSGLTLHGRVITTSREVPFERVRVSLHGAIKTQVGARTTVEQFSPTTEMRPASDFVPMCAESGIVGQERLEFSLAVPSAEKKTSRANANGNLLPSTSISGIKCITRSSALSDRERVSGICEITYWVEVDFISSSNSSLRKLSCPVDIPSVPLSISLSASGNSDYIYQLAKPRQNIVRRVLSSQSHNGPTLSVKIPRDLGSILYTDKGHGYISLPLTIALQTTADSNIPALSSTQCDVYVRWSRFHSFGGEVRVQHSDVASQSLKGTLPPLYKAENGLQTTSTVLELDIPKIMCVPSTATRLLDVRYRLEMIMSFNIGHVRRDLEIKAPVILVARPDQEILDLSNPVPGIDDAMVMGPPAYFP